LTQVLVLAWGGVMAQGCGWLMGLGSLWLWRAMASVWWARLRFSMGAVEACWNWG